MMTLPLLPMGRFEPVCSGCQWVLMSVLTRVLPVDCPTVLSSALELAARPPSINSAPSGPGMATTLQPAPWSSVSPPLSFGVSGAVDMAGAPAASVVRPGANTLKGPRTPAAVAAPNT